MHDEAALQHVDPGAGSCVRHTGVVAQAAQIEQLSGTPCTQTHKPFESLQVLHSGELTQVTLHIGGKIIRQRLRGVETPVMNARIKPGQQGLREIGWRFTSLESPYFCQRERQQAQHGGSPRQRL